MLREMALVMIAILSLLGNLYLLKQLQKERHRAIVKDIAVKIRQRCE